MMSVGRQQSNAADPCMLRLASRLLMDDFSSPSKVIRSLLHFGQTGCYRSVIFAGTGFILHERSP